jgi:cell division protease FtsH
MVTQFGMSKKLGPLTFGDKEELIFLGRQLSEQRNYSEEVAELIDFEVRRLVDEAHQRALSILNDHVDLMHVIAKKLMEDETLNAEEFTALVEGDHTEESPNGESASESSDKKSREDTSSSEDSPPQVIPPSTAPLPA